MVGIGEMDTASRSLSLGRMSAKSGETATSGMKRPAPPAAATQASSDSRRASLAAAGETARVARAAAATHRHATLGQGEQHFPAVHGAVHAHHTAH